MDPVTELRENGVARGDLVGLVVAPAIGVALAGPTATTFVAAALESAARVVERVEAALRPRWVMWSNATAAPLVEAGVRIATSWDIAAIHRLLYGGWAADPPRVWAELHDLALESIPTTAPPDLFNQGTHDDGNPDEPVRPDGYLRADWATGAWSSTPARLVQWARLAYTAAGLQHARVAALPDPARAAMTARTESAAELLCAELSVDGLPMDRAVAEGIITALVGARPRSETEATEQRARRDAEVMRHAPPGVGCELRSASVSTFPTRAPGDWNPCAKLIRLSTRCSRGGRRNGSALPTATRGSTSSSIPTVACAGRGRVRMAPRAG